MPGDFVGSLAMLVMIDVAAKPAGRTFGVFLALDADAPPDALLGEIEAFGVRKTVSKSYKHQSGKKVLDVHYKKAGTDLFEGWTAAERDANLQALEALFARSSILVTPRIMTLAEAF